MWYKRLYIAPGAFVLPAACLLLFPPVLLLSILAAALLHELGHYAVLRLTKGTVKSITITALGVEMEARGQRSYLQDILLSGAGPAVNLILSLLLSRLGPHWGICYLFSGAHLILGLFNLLPILPLDGGMMLWSAAAWCFEPYTADRFCTIVGLTTALLLCAASLWLFLQGGSAFLLIASLGLLRGPLQQIGLVKLRQTG